MGHHEYNLNKIKMMAQSEFESESQRPERHRIDQATPLGLVRVKRKLYNKTIAGKFLDIVNKSTSHIIPGKHTFNGLHHNSKISIQII